MSVAILRPTGAGAFSEWASTGAATGWQATASVSESDYAAAATGGLRDRYTFEDLPADATGVTSLSVYGSCAADAGGVAATRYVLRLSGTESNGATFEPPDGGYAVFSTAFTTAPGSLAWTAARVNALEAGPDSVSGPQVYVASLWLYVEYTTSIAAPSGGPATIDMGSTAAVLDSVSDSDLALPQTTADVTIGGQNPVDLSIAGDTSPSLEMETEGS